MAVRLEAHGPWALVAGASEGLGAAFSEALASRGFNLVLVARRTQPLEELATRLGAGVQVRTITADLGAPDAAERLAGATDDIEVGLVVYNAAAATIGPWLDTSTASKLVSIDVNCRGPVAVLDAFVPAMVERGHGGVVLMGSMSGLVGTAMVTTYGATKGFLRVLGEGLWEELSPHGIDVVTSIAGAISTPNFLRETPTDAQATALPLSPDVVAEATLAALGSGPLVVPGLMNRLVAWFLERVATRRMAVRFMSNNTRRLYEGRR